MQNPWLEYCLLCVLALLWGSSYLFIKVALADLPPLTLIAVRVSGAALLLSAVVIWRGYRLPRDRTSWSMLLMQAFLNAIVPWTVLAWGQQFVDAALASVLNSTSPIFVLIFTALVTRHETLGATRFAGVALGLGGVIFVVGVGALAGLGNQVAGQLACVFGAALYGCAGGAPTGLGVPASNASYGTYYALRMHYPPPPDSAKGSMAPADNIIDGRTVAAAVRRDVRSGVEAWTSDGHDPPGLAVVLVGDDPASAAYVRGKMKASEEVGIESTTIRRPNTIGEQELLDLVRKLNDDPGVDGILVQLPLPDHIDDRKIVHAVDPQKDVDGFHPENVGRLLVGDPAFVSATPAGIMELLRRSSIETSGRHAVVLGRSNIVGKPVAALLMQRGTDATVTICHSRTRNLPEITRSADLLVAAIGRAHFVTADMVKHGVVVIDVGINRIDDPSRERGYRLVGDVDFDRVREKAARITPVPGGVGPMTIGMLLRNTLAAARGDFRGR